MLHITYSSYSHDLSYYNFNFFYRKICSKGNGNGHIYLKIETKDAEDEKLMA